MNRRTLLKGGVAAVALTAGGTRLTGWALAEPALPAGALAEQTLEALPGKVPLIRKTYRPPNYETPIEYFEDAYTRNDAFFVRYHLSSIPEVDPATWRLEIRGAGATAPASFSLDELRNGFERAEVTAVCQCSGNRRGLSDPHVPGVEWGYGAMGNARWAGVRLKDVLARIGVAQDAVEVAFDGADGPPIDKTPDFVKSIPLWKAVEDNTLIAFEMNGEPLPRWNGAPARIVVPGWTATYWMKHLTTIDVLTQPLKQFWVTNAYRVPKALFPVVQRFVSQEAPESPNTPITEMVVNSLITNLKEGQEIPSTQPVEVRGIAWDGGYGIAEVGISTDGGKTWQAAVLGEDLGRYSWRQWSHSFTARPGVASVMARARNKAGQVQVDQLLFNGAGYHNNVIQTINFKVV